VIRRIIAQFLIKRGFSFNKDYNLFLRILKSIIDQKGNVIIAVIGAPGSGKSKFIHNIKQNGFGSIESGDIYIIDDLRDFEGNRYMIEDLQKIIEATDSKIFILSDYRGALYLRKVDIILYLKIDERKRRENLLKRKSKKFFYKTMLYRISPIPLRFLSKPLFIIDTGRY